MSYQEAEVKMRKIYKLTRFVNMRKTGKKAVPISVFKFKSRSAASSKIS